MILSKKSKMILSRNREYHLFNFLVFSTILLLIFYLKTDIISIKCPYTEIGIQCKTCGLTTSFKKILNCRFIGINSGHLLLFIAFIAQLLVRPFVSLVLLFSFKLKLIRNVDIFFSVFLFGFAYIKLLMN
jgi:hypothetical protein